MSRKINRFSVVMFESKEPRLNCLFQALSKKESKGGMDSPLGDDSDHEADFTLTPRTEAKYNKIDEEFHLMMQRNQLNGGRVSVQRVLLSSCTFLVREEEEEEEEEDSSQT